MDSKKVIITLIVVVLSLAACGKESPVESPISTQPTQIQQVSSNDKKDDETQASSESQSYQFNVGGNDVDSNTEHEYEIPNDRIPVDCKIIQSFDGKDCVILYDVDDAKLNNYKTEKSIASYSYRSSTQMYYLYVTIENERSNNAYNLIQGKKNEGADIRTESTPFGDAYFYKDVNDAATITYGTLLMKNGYYCTLKFTTDIDFDEAVTIMRKIYDEGITVVIPSDSLSEEAESN